MINLFFPRKTESLFFTTHGILIFVLILLILSLRLRGITKSISRYPTFKRRFESSIKIILEELAKKNGDSRKSEDAGPQRTPRSKSMFVRMFSEKSFKTRNDQEAQLVDSDRDVEIQ